MDCEKEEALNLQKEFEWVLHEEVHTALDQIHQILVECARRFPVALYGNEHTPKLDKYVLTVPQDQLKCVVTLHGDSISHADITIKVQRQQMTIIRTSIVNDNPWKLQQIQDAANHLQQAIYHIDDVGKSYKFKSSDEVLHILGNILGSLQRGRTSLIVPRKRAMDDLMKSRNMKTLSPNLPEDIALSFYLQSHKLMVAMYQLTNSHGNVKFDSCHAECSIPWLNEVLVLFTVGLQLCQQLKDKVALIMGVSGACRCCELTHLKISDVEDKNAYLLVSIPDTKTGTLRKFTIMEGFSINSVETCRRYMSLRPKALSNDFLRYTNQKYTSQPVGINTLSKVPSRVASFLNLANAEAYSGHCMRRTSTTLLANKGADLTTIKRHSGWRSSAVVERYIEDSISNKLDIARKIQGTPGTSPSVQEETSLVSTDSSKSSTSSMRSENDYKLVINGNEVKYSKTKNELSIDINVNVNINNKM